ncbi:MAG: NAD(P)H-dependent oxidoreductase, partial [Gammaproteobacteria bacterium]|nr:NAD(P)H-dependent oxidoreductase [Gammaproteobacteria bacterium]
GLLKNKKAFAIVVSGGTSIDSDIDFATPYLRHILSFVGITDLTIIGSSMAGLDEETAHQKALDSIRSAVI